MNKKSPVNNISESRGFLLGDTTSANYCTFAPDCCTASTLLHQHLSEHQSPEEGLCPLPVPGHGHRLRHTHQGPALHTALHRTAHCTALYCALQCTILRIALHRTVHCTSHSTALYCPFCTALYCLFYTALQGMLHQTHI